MTPPKPKEIPLPPTDRFCDRLWWLIKTNGTKTEEIAKLVGRTRTAVQNWEKGMVEPNIASIRAIAKYYGVTTDFLLGVSDKR